MFKLSVYYVCVMENTEEKKPRKPLLSIEVSEEEKELFKKVAKARRLSLSAVARLLLLDEARRLGILLPSSEGNTSSPKKP